MTAKAHAGGATPLLHDSDYEPYEDYSYGKYDNDGGHITTTGSTPKSPNRSTTQFYQPYQPPIHPHAPHHHHGTAAIAPFAAVSPRHRHVTSTTNTRTSTSSHHTRSTIGSQLPGVSDSSTAGAASASTVLRIAATPRGRKAAAIIVTRQRRQLQLQQQRGWIVVRSRLFAILSLVGLVLVIFLVQQKYLSHGVVQVKQQQQQQLSLGFGRTRSGSGIPLTGSIFVELLVLQVVVIVLVLVTLVLCSFRTSIARILKRMIWRGAAAAAAGGTAETTATPFQLTRGGGGGGATATQQHKSRCRINIMSITIFVVLSMLSVLVLMFKAATLFLSGADRGAVTGGFDTLPHNKHVLVHSHGHKNDPKIISAADFNSASLRNPQQQQQQQALLDSDSSVAAAAAKNRSSSLAARVSRKDTVTLSDTADTTIDQPPVAVEKKDPIAVVPSVKVKIEQQQEDPSQRHQQVQLQEQPNKKTVIPNSAQDVLSRSLNWDSPTVKVHKLSENLIQTDRVIVTAYFNVKSKHSSGAYDKWMSNILSVQDAIIIYTQADYVEQMMYYRDHANSSTVIVELALSDLPISQLRTPQWPTSEDFWQNQLDIDPEKSRHQSYQLFWIWLSKSWLVAQSVQNCNFFQSQFFFYSDIGSFRNTKYYGRTILRHTVQDIYPGQEQHHQHPPPHIGNNSSNNNNNSSLPLAELPVLFMAHHVPRSPPHYVWTDKFGQKEYYFHSGSQAAAFAERWLAFHAQFAYVIDEFLGINNDSDNSNRQELFIGEDQCVLQGTCQSVPGMCAYIPFQQVNDNHYFGLRYAMHFGGKYYFWKHGDPPPPRHVKKH